MKKTNTKNLVLTGMMAAVLAIMSQISIPLPSGVPVTMQTFAVALTSFVLGAGSGSLAVVIYMLVGLIGLPVFAGFTAGPGCFVSLPGGFLTGFLPMVFCCGLATSLRMRRVDTAAGNMHETTTAVKNKPKLTAVRFHALRPALIALFSGMLGLTLCHLFGVCQFAFLSGNSIPASFLLVSVPYLLKDVLSVLGAYLVSLPIRRAIARI